MSRRLSLTQLPYEILIYFFEYFEIREFKNLYLASKVFSQVLKREDLYERLSKIYGVDVTEKPSKTSYKIFFIDNYSSLKITFVYTSFYPDSKETVEKSLLKFFNQDVVDNTQFLDINQSHKINKTNETDLSERELFEIIDESSVILFFGGNGTRTTTKEKIGTYLYNYLRKKRNRSVITLMWSHGSYDDPWQLSGVWKDMKMNVMDIRINSTLGDSRNSNMVCDDEYFKKLVEDSNVTLGGHGSVYETDITKPVNFYNENANLLMSYANGSEENKKVTSWCLVERVDMNYLQCNFDLNNSTCDLVSLCIKYMNERKRRKYWINRLVK